MLLLSLLVCPIQAYDMISRMRRARTEADEFLAPGDKRDVHVIFKVVGGTFFSELGRKTQQIVE